MYEPDFYQVPRLLPDEPLPQDPTFIVYGDNQATWRVLQKFLLPRNWQTWNMLIFPFYELYWIGNGLWGWVNWQRNVPDYGEDTRLMMRDVIYAEWKKTGSDFILNVGDIAANDGRRPQHWAQFLEENKHQHPLLNEAPYLPTAGNHERYGSEPYGKANFEAIFDYPAFYVVESPSMALFVLDANIIVDWRDQIDDEEQNRLFTKWFVSDDPSRPAWLEQKLMEHDKPYKIVSMHQCPVSFGFHWKDWFRNSYGQGSIEKRRKVLELFRDNGVQVVFSGHDHIYEHNILKSIDAVSLGDSEIHFIVSSGGGVTLREPTSPGQMERIKQLYTDEGFEVVPESHFKAYHYTLVEVSPENLAIRTYTVPTDSPRDRHLLDELVIPHPEH